MKFAHINGEESATRWVFCLASPTRGIVRDRRRLNHRSVGVRGPADSGFGAVTSGWWTTVASSGVSPPANPKACLSACGRSRAWMGVYHKPMVPNAGFWAQYFRQYHVQAVEGFRAGALEKVVAAFNSIAEEADAAAEAEFERLGSMPADDGIDMGDVAEWATEHGIEYYETMSGVRQGVLNLRAVGLHHLFEQQQLSFGESWLVEKRERTKRRHSNGSSQAWASIAGVFGAPASSTNSGWPRTPSSTVRDRLRRSWQHFGLISTRIRSLPAADWRRETCRGRVPLRRSYRYS